MNIEHRTSNIEHRTSNIEHRTSNTAPRYATRSARGMPLLPPLLFISRITAVPTIPPLAELQAADAPPDLGMAAAPALQRHGDQ
ncbi:MAG: hypothetical protein NTV22_14165 [bacterium]|nr:hypothetical protein [bacterium]